MTTLLIPGRHILHTKFQEDYIQRILQGNNIDQLIFAITSCNQDNSRYNPLPFEIRHTGVDRFARQFKEKFGIEYRIFGIPHFNPTPHYAEFTLKEIAENTGGEVFLHPKNTIVYCSTEEIADMYLKAGFKVLRGELDQRGPKRDRPIELLQKIVKAGKSWERNREIRKKLSDASLSLFGDFKWALDHVFWLYKDPLLSETGNLTDTRDYTIYGYSMGQKDVIEIKYQDIKNLIKPGRIVDEGCADGVLFVLIARDFPDSDLIGIEITGKLIAEAKQRQRRGDFGGTYTHFHQRNLTEKIFREGSIDTTICNSTTHEIWSYGKGKSSLKKYLRLKFWQTRKGGRLIIRDVVGNESPYQQVYMLCNDKDGSNEDIFKQCDDSKQLTAHLDGLSTYARFLRFAEDYLSDMRASGKRGPNTKIKYKIETRGSINYFVLNLKDAVEFMTKKDYTGNWQSEMNEEFAFWGFWQWKEAIKKAGFSVIENPNEPELGSRTYTSEWIMKNRWYDKVILYREADGRLERMDYPPTNIVLAGEKR